MARTIVLCERPDPVPETDERRLRLAPEGVVERAHAERKEDRAQNEHDEANQPGRQKHIRPEHLVASERPARSDHRSGCGCSSRDHLVVPGPDSDVRLVEDVLHLLVGVIGKLVDVELTQGDLVEFVDQDRLVFGIAAIGRMVPGEQFGPRW